MEEITEERLREICGSKHYTEWTASDFARSWEHYMESNPDTNEWEFKYRPSPENIVNCEKATNKMKVVDYGFIWSMTVDDAWITIRVTRPLAELNIAL